MYRDRQPILLKIWFQSIGQTSHQTNFPNSWNPNIPQIGRISIESMKKLLPPPNNDTLIMLCGTPGMKDIIYGPKENDINNKERIFNGYLSKLGYTKNMIYVF